MFKKIILSLSLVGGLSQACPLTDGFESGFVGQQLWGNQYFSVVDYFGLHNCQGSVVQKIVFNAASPGGAPPSVAFLSINGQNVGVPVWITPGVLGTYQLFLPANFNQLGYQIQHLGVNFQGQVSLYDINIYAFPQNNPQQCEQQKAYFRIERGERGGAQLGCQAGCRITSAGYSVSSYGSCRETNSQMSYRVSCKNLSPNFPVTGHAWVNCEPLN